MVKGLTKALDRLLAVDCDGLTDGESHDAVIGMQRERARLDAMLARLLVAGWEQRRVWEDDGSKAASARLSRECRISARAAHAEIRRAGGLRRAIEVRDRHCTHPGCRVPAARCHVDHITEHAKGGPTTQDNGRLLCPVHNRRRLAVGPAP